MLFDRRAKCSAYAVPPKFRGYEYATEPWREMFMARKVMHTKSSSAKNLYA